MRLLRFLSVVILLTPAPAVQARYDVNERHDLDQVLSLIACNQQVLSTPELWAREVFDAQIAGRRIPRIQVERVSTPGALAREFAMRHHALSASFGLCPDLGSYWIAALQARRPLTLGPKAALIPVADLEAQCSSFSVSFVAALGGTSRRLPISPATSSVDLTELPPGTMEISCSPKEKNRSPQIWFLAPVGLGPLRKVPGLEALASTPKSEEGLLAWINAVRSRVSLATLKWDVRELHELAQLLGVTKSVAHDVATLRDSSLQFRKQHRLEILGENRAIAPDLEQVAWLLWNSPEHRDLVLHSEAERVGAIVEAISGAQFVVLVFAKNSKKL